MDKLIEELKKDIASYVSYLNTKVQPNTLKWEYTDGYINGMKAVLWKLEDAWKEQQDGSN